MALILCSSNVQEIAQADADDFGEVRAEVVRTEIAGEKNYF
ncbi:MULTISPECIES: hypothetical protein [unclassified Pseudomonas]|nr:MULTISPECIES: hypothetical protein [unclassified Pseudomonas]